MGFRHGDHVHDLPDEPGLDEQIEWFRAVSNGVPVCALDNLFTEKFVSWVCQMVGAEGDGCPDIMAKFEQALQCEADAVLERDRCEIGHVKYSQKALARADEIHDLSDELRAAQAECKAHLILLWEVKARLLDLLVKGGELKLGGDE